MPVSRIRAARAAAMLSCALVLTLSACNNSESAPAGGGGHDGGHQAPHSGTHPTSHHTPAAPTGEFNPRNCPTGLVC